MPWTDAITQGNVIRLDFGVTVNVITGRPGIQAYAKLREKALNTRCLFERYTDKQIGRIFDDNLLACLFTVNTKDSDVIHSIERNAGALYTPGKQDDWLFCRPVYGLTFPRMRVFGNVTFCKKSSLIRRVPATARCRLPAEMSDWEHCVCLQWSGKPSEKVHEETADRFELIENLFNFLVGNKDTGHGVRIVSPPSTVFHTIVRIGKNSLGSSWSVERSVHRSLDLNDPFFSQKHVKNLIALCGSFSRDQVQQRLATSIKWAGKAVGSKSSIETIIACCNAMESLLIRDTKGSIISPSIMASLSEMAAFLIDKSVDGRLSIVQMIKSIYSIRSAGVHGGTTSASSMDESKALQIARALIHSIADLYNKGLRTDQQLTSHVDRIKFS